MVERIQAVRGMNDVLPEQTVLWRRLENSFVQCLTQYGYQEIRFPLLESTFLFQRTGDSTDIVEKEMYTFQDINGDSLTIRPEGTAGCVRACLEHGLLHNQQQKLWYFGPMFRHEKPQKGRYRQFHQFGVEVFGIDGVGIELELLLMCQRFWNALGVSHALQLQVNTLGTLAERQQYRDALVQYFKPHFDSLDDDSKRRLDKNPLRILDSTNPGMRDLIAAAPKLLDVVGDDSRQRFATLCNGLQALGIPYTVNPFLVRGLDYYGQTVFEWVTDQLGSQATVCAGGRFDVLVEQLGGNPTPAVGFAMGEERLLLLMDALHVNAAVSASPMLYFISDSDDAMQSALHLAESLRNEEPQWPIVVHTSGGSFKSQFKKADKSGALFALILGAEEMRDRTISVKHLRGSGEQVTVPQHELSQYIRTLR